MNSLRNTFYRSLPILRIMLSLIWLTNLSGTDAYFLIYVLIAFFSLYLFLHRCESSQVFSRTGNIGLILLSLLFSAAVLLANYPIFTTVGDPALIGRSTSILMNLINSSLSLLGGICIFYPIFCWFFSVFPLKGSYFSPFKFIKFLPWIAFLSIACLHLLHLFFVEYPGNVTEDTFSQISEMISGNYSNFNTYWHTRLLQLVLSCGYGFFYDINASIAFFCVIQILFLSFAFTHCLMSMRFYGIPNWFVFSAWLVYAVIPYNMALSVTVWKDVLFAGSGLLIVSSLMRILHELGTTWKNYALFSIGAILFILSRTNGWLIFGVFAIVIIFTFRRRKVLATVSCLLALLGWFSLNPALSVLNVQAGDPVESLSVPIQQVSRVIAEGKTLTEEETELLEHVIDIEDVSTLYTQWLSDPMKVEVRSKDYSYFMEHLSEYRDLWIRLGLKYPVEYIEAWVEQTKGYWNAGYPYTMYSETITDNSYGAEKSSGSNIIASLFHLYFGLSRHLIFFEPLHSIGLHIWITILCFVLNFFKRRKQFILSVPYLLLTVGLWFGTPVYSCFRYVYPLFVAFPLILSTALYEPHIE